MQSQDKEKLIMAHASRVVSQNKARNAIDSAIDRKIIDALIGKYGLRNMQDYIEATSNRITAEAICAVLSAHCETGDTGSATKTVS